MRGLGGLDQGGGLPPFAIPQARQRQLFALGLAALGASQGVGSLFAAWVLIGLAVASGLYEVAFSTLLQFYGHGSRNAITGTPLIAGFASTLG